MLKNYILRLFFMSVFVLGIQAQTQLSVDIITNHSLSSCNASDLDIGTSVTGGQSPYTYEWKNTKAEVIGTSPNLTGLSSGVYQVFVKDSNGDMAYDSVSVNTGIVYISGNPANCPISDGSAQIYTYGSFTPPLNILWSNGATTETITGLAANEELTVQVTDAVGCKLIFPQQEDSNPYEGKYTIQANASFQVSTSVIHENCNQSNGSATANVLGGNGPFTYLWNTSPVQTSALATNLSSDFYSVTVTDVNGCKGNGYAYISVISGITASISGTKATCDESNGSITLSASGGQTPYTFTWSNGSSAQNLTGIPSGWYSVEIEDANGCIERQSLGIGKQSPIQLSFSKTNADCNNQNGSIDLTVSGGTEPYSYYWSNQATSEDISNLSFRYYWVYVTDANGCDGYSYTKVITDPACTALISGKVFQDNNFNCVYDAGEPQLPESYISLTEVGNYSDLAVSDLQGDFLLVAPYSASYSVASHLYSPHYSSICPGQSQTISVASGVNEVVNFAYKPKEIGVDLVPHLYSGNARPGFTHQYWLEVKNKGTESLVSGSVTVQLGADETLVSYQTAPSSYDITTKTLEFSITNLPVGYSKWILFSCSLLPTIPLGTQYEVSVVANPVSGDLIEEDNTLIRHQVVVGSYDPNDIQVLKQGDLTLNKDTTLSYFIRFQNTGTFPAEFVVVRDTLEIDIDVNSIRDVQTSHPVEVSMEQGNILVFTFNNIMLSDSNSNEKESHGFISYKVNLKKNLTTQHEIVNSAAIYFDYNVPVLTNKAKSRITDVNGILSGTESANVVSVFPNPAKDKVKFEFGVEIEQIELFSLTGQLVLRQFVDGKSVELNNTVSKGMHFYKAIGADGLVYSGKLLFE